MITYVMPTRNRPAELARSLEALEALGRLGGHAPGAAEVLIADNASDPPAQAPATLRDGTRVRVLRSERNLAAAARNLAAREADSASGWLVMLDDDSAPLDTGHLEAMAAAPADVGAIAAEIFLPPGTAGEAARGGSGGGLGADGRDGRDGRDEPGPTRHESGGLPEVFVGCGVAIRREAFLKLGGYDERFGYYAEEYDFSARLLRAGYRVVMDRRFKVMHRKAAAGRSFSRIIRRLVRNNAWVAQRYAPDDQRQAELHETIRRYGRIALKERVPLGYLAGLGELSLTLHRQARCPLAGPAWDRLTGLAHARRALSAAASTAPLGRVALAGTGKNAWAVVQALREAGVDAASLVGDARDADTIVIATLSPGPMLDAYDAAMQTHAADGRRVVLPWIEALHPAPCYGQGAPGPGGPGAPTRPVPGAGAGPSLMTAA